MASISKHWGIFKSTSKMMLVIVVVLYSGDFWGICWLNRWQILFQIWWGWLMTGTREGSTYVSRVAQTLRALPRWQATDIAWVHIG